MLYDYFNQLKSLERLREEYEQVCKLEQSLRIELNCDIKGISYDTTRVQSSAGNPTESSYISAERQYEKERKEANKQKLKIHGEIITLELKLLRLSGVLNSLNDEEKEIITLKYKDCLSYRSIGKKLYMGIATVHDKLKRIDKHIKSELRRTK